MSLPSAAVTLLAWDLAARNRNLLTTVVQLSEVAGKGSGWLRLPEGALTNHAVLQNPGWRHEGLTAEP